MILFYISFATDTEFLGATVVFAHDAADALEDATMRGLNPGGQAAILSLPEAANELPEAKIMLNRLMTKDDMEREVPYKRHGDLNDSERHLIDIYAVLL